MRNTMIANCILAVVAITGVCATYAIWSARTAQTQTPDVVQQLTSPNGPSPSSEEMSSPEAFAARRAAALQSKMSGLVFDDHMRPVAGAQVSAVAVKAGDLLSDSGVDSNSLPSQVIADAVSDSEGRFELGDHPQNPSLVVFVACRLTGYLDTQVRAHVGHETSILLSPTATRIRLSGSVVDESARAVAYFEIQLQRRSGQEYAAMPELAVSSRDGRFDLEFDVPTRFLFDLFVLVSAPGLQSETLGPFQLHNELAVRDLSFVLRRPRNVIPGFVFTEQGAAVAGADVSMIGSNGRPLGHIETAPDGSFSLPVFSADSHGTVYVEKPGLSPNWVSWNLVESGEREIIVILRDSARLVVQLKQASSENVPRSIALWATRRPSVMFPDYYVQANCNVAGIAEFKGVPYGPVNVTLLDAIGSGRETRYSQRLLTTVIISERDSQIELALPHGVSIRGRVSVPRLPATATVWLELSERESVLVASMQTKSDAPFLFSAVPSGEYVLRVAVNEDAVYRFRVVVGDEDLDIGLLECQALTTETRR